MDVQHADISTLWDLTVILLSSFVFATKQHNMISTESQDRYWHRHTDKLSPWRCCYIVTVMEAGIYLMLRSCNTYISLCWQVKRPKGIVENISSDQTFIYADFINKCLSMMLYWKCLFLFLSFILLPSIPFLNFLKKAKYLPENLKRNHDIRFYNYYLCINHAKPNLWQD